MWEIAITDLSKNEVKTLWESGVPLDYAWVEFARFFDNFALTALRTHPINDADVLGLDHPRYQQLNKGWLPKTWEGRQKKLEITTRNERISLLGEIYAGRLWAIGCRTLPDGSDENVRVPREYFYSDEQEEVWPEINWPMSALRGGGISYFDIRVIEPPDLSKPRRRGEEEESSSHDKGGRPNTKDEIVRMTKRLLDDCAFRAKRRLDQAVEVRVAILGEESRDQHDRPGYKTETIVRIIGTVDKVGKE